jgi:hypothetical protein
MPKLVVNPGTPQTWEIQLKPGLNFLGRGASNDFKLDDLSVSGSHCQIMVDGSTATIKDMGSTNGTFVNRAKIQESRLESGQPLRLGSLDMIFYTDGAATAVAAPPPPPPPVPRAVPASPAAPAALKPAGLKVSGLSHAPVAAPVAVADAPPEPEMDTGVMEVGARYCKFHPKSPARFLCRKCNRCFCDLCVTSRNAGAKIIKTCRSCGVECVPVQFQAAPSKGFYASLLGAFAYPFKGAGVIILICATVAYSALKFVRGGLFGIFISIGVVGGIFLFMQNIIHTTTSDENEDIGFPDFSGTFGAALQLAVIFLASFWLLTGLTVAKFFDVDIPVEALIASRILGLIYFPMALLAVAMKDSPLAANPLVVLPAMLKAPVEYGITVLFLLAVYAVGVVGEMWSSSAGHSMMFTKNMSTFFEDAGIECALALVRVYLLCVTMRLLGLFYNASKEKLGWFSR